MDQPQFIAEGYQGGSVRAQNVTADNSDRIFLADYPEYMDIYLRIRSPGMARRPR